MTNESLNQCLTADSAEVLFAYVDGTLAPRQAAALELHATGCEACRTLIEGQQAMWAVLDTWEAPKISPDFNRKMHAAVAAEAEQEPWLTKSARRTHDWLAGLAGAWKPRHLLVPAGALALLVATVVLMQMPRPETVPVVDQKAGLENDVKQMERTLDDIDVLSTLDAAISSQEKL